MPPGVSQDTMVQIDAVSEEIPMDVQFTILSHYPLTFQLLFTHHSFGRFQVSDYFYQRDLQANLIASVTPSRHCAPNHCTMPVTGD